jgi:LemA protein
VQKGMIHKKETIMIMIAGILALLVALVLYAITIYNNLISLKNNVSKNWSNIDVLLKQRYSELPKLIDTCKEYMQYEKGTLEKIVTARQAAITATEGRDVIALGQAESSLKNGLLKLFALAENYPDLKTNGSFQKLQARISDLENNIADRRELYNESVNINNTRIQQFPDILIAKIFDFKSFELLKFSKVETEDVGIEDHFKT